MITKEKLLETIKNMPEEKFKDLDSVLEEIILLDKIESSLQAAAKGKVLTEEEMDKLVDSW
jgi:predicted transcriptional regulator